MCPETSRVKHNGISSPAINSGISTPKIPMHQCRSNLAAISLQRSQKAGNDFAKERREQDIQFGTGPARSLLAHF